jgi:hypothetical protein
LVELDDPLVPGRFSGCLSELPVEELSDGLTEEPLDDEGSLDSGLSVVIGALLLPVEDEASLGIELELPDELCSRALSFCSSVLPDIAGAFSSVVAPLEAAPLP